jgi:hypothetical protein
VWVGRSCDSGPVSCNYRGSLAIPHCVLATGVLKSLQLLACRNSSQRHFTNTTFRPEDASLLSLLWKTVRLTVQVVQKLVVNFAIYRLWIILTTYSWIISQDFQILDLILGIYEIHQHKLPQSVCRETHPQSALEIQKSLPSAGQWSWTPVSLLYCTLFDHNKLTGTLAHPW